MGLRQASQLKGRKNLVAAVSILGLAPEWRKLEDERGSRSYISN
jgi:hypothetical protein